jgi:hypothetical protein
MTLTENEIKPYRAVLDNLNDHAKYNAQTYFEAAKRAELWGKTIVLVPALVAGVSGVLVALGVGKEWGVASAIAGVIAATASFLGAERKAPSYRESARRYTQLKHKVQLVQALALQCESIEELGGKSNELQEEYLGIVGRDEPVSNKFYETASKRVEAGSI